VAICGRAGMFLPPALTGPPDFGLIFAARISACSLTGSLGRAKERPRQFEGPRCSLRVGSGITKREGVFGAGRFFRSELCDLELCDQVRSPCLSEPLTGSAVFLGFSLGGLMAYPNPKLSSPFQPQPVGSGFPGREQGARLRGHRAAWRGPHELGPRSTRA
jgi:hypothetical protein